MSKFVDHVDAVMGTVEVGSDLKRRGRRVDCWWWRRLEMAVAAAIGKGRMELASPSIGEEKRVFSFFF